MKHARASNPALHSATAAAQVLPSSSSRGLDDSKPFDPNEEVGGKAAAKIGRNDPCPCGSGKKYKKCCLGKAFDGNQDPSPPFESVGPGTVSSPARTTGVHVAPYTLAKLLDDEDRVVRLTGGERASFANRWSPRKMAALSTESIEEGLLSRGIEYSRPAFVGAAHGYVSAWDAAHCWDKGGSEGAAWSDGFVGLAACELWRRFCPSRPSLEMIDDWMSDGYQQLEGRRSLAALELWMQAWTGLRPLVQPQTRNLMDADRSMFQGRTQMLSNWVRDFCLEAVNGALQEPLCAPLGIRFIEEMLATFPEESSDLHFLHDLATLHFRCGQIDRGRGLFDRLIADHADRASGYVGLSDALAYGQGQGTARDLQEAIRVLERARAYPVKDGNDFDLDARLHGLREKFAAFPVPRQ